MHVPSTRAVRRVARDFRHGFSRTSQIVRTRHAENRVVCVLGMHRSGTSALVGTLEESGLYLGRLITLNPHNPRGDREHGPIQWLNDAILAYNGGSWDDPPASIAWSSQHLARRDEIVRSFEPVRVWGFKDPRTLLLLDFWRNAVQRMDFVGTFRHPLAVVESLLERDGGARDRWLELWVRHNEPLADLHEAHPFPLIDFDLDDEAYRAGLAAAVSELGLRPPRRPRFFDPRFRHHEPRALDGLPAAVAELYDRLRRAAGSNSST